MNLDTTSESYNLVFNFFKDEEYKARLWFFTKNPLLGGMMPIEMIDKGRGDTLLNFIKSQLSENKL
jgi:hypothetical protein